MSDYGMAGEALMEPAEANQAAYGQYHNVTIGGGAGGAGAYPTPEPPDWRMQQEYAIANTPPTPLSTSTRRCHNQTHVFACRHEEVCECGTCHRIVMPDGI